MILHRIQIPEGLLLSGSRSDFFGESLALGNPFNRTSPNPGEKVLTDSVFVFIFRSTVVTYRDTYYTDNVSGICSHYCTFIDK